MSLVDCAIVGRLGADALAATGASISIFSLAGLLVSFLSYVTVPAVAEASTQGDSAEVSRVISTGVWIAVVAGIFVTGFIIGIGPLILGSMRLEAAVVEQAKGYVWARALGSVGYLLVLVGSGSFRGMQVSFLDVNRGYLSGTTFSASDCIQQQQATELFKFRCNRSLALSCNSTVYMLTEWPNGYQTCCRLSSHIWLHYVGMSPATVTIFLRPVTAK